MSKTMTGDGEISYKVEVTKISKRLKRTKEWLRVKEEGQERPYDYVETDAVVTETTEIYHQIVTVLNLKAVIDAVNAT